MHGKCTCGLRYLRTRMDIGFLVCPQRADETRFLVVDHKPAGLEASAPSSHNTSHT